MKERKLLRLPDYDYSQAGLYFLTLCAKDKAPLFGKVCVGAASSTPRRWNFLHAVPLFGSDWKKWHKSMNTYQ